MKWTHSRYSVEMIDERAYSFASTDNVRTYDEELLLAGRFHQCSNERAIIAHGELEVSKWTFDGNQLWTFSGADIFTGALSIVDGTVVVEDFEGQVYRIELGTGRALS